MIHTIDKFNYLLNCLEGQVLVIIEKLQVVEENYQKSPDCLKDRCYKEFLICIDNVIIW